MRQSCYSTISDGYFHQGGDRSEDLNLTREARSHGARGKKQKKEAMSTELHHMQRVGWLGLIKE